MKNSLKFLFGAFSLLLLFSGCSTPQIQIFNGKDLDNWIIFTEKDSVDPQSMFWVEEGMIRTSGMPNGYIRTRDLYSNFLLHVEWRWLEEPTNSGVLINVRGKDMVWPNAIECQLMHEHAGDLVLIGKGAGITVGDSTYLVTSEENRFIMIPKEQESSEHAPGEWNSYDITCVGGSVEVKVNGVLQNEGTDLTLTQGYILLQSEGSPMQFRNIYLEER
ncbi:MAG: 3-keto-disaccharide hydrolase [Bacteroidales bacterium]